MSDRRVQLNVGGKLFETLRSTLSGSSYFEARLSDRWNPACVSKEDEKEIVVFLDRDPVGFAHVLNLLRDSNYPFPFQRYGYELGFYGVDWEDERDGSPGEDDEKPLREPLEEKEISRYDARQMSGALAGVLGSNASRQIDGELGTNPSFNSPEILDRAIGVPLRILPPVFPTYVATEEIKVLSLHHGAEGIRFDIPKHADICADAVLNFRLAPVGNGLPLGSVAELMVSGILERVIENIWIVVNDQRVDSIDGSSLVRYNLLGDATLPPLPTGRGSTLRDRIHRETDRFSLRLPMFQTYLKDDGVLRPFWFFPGMFAKSWLDVRIRNTSDYEWRDASLSFRSILIPYEERDAVFSTTVPDSLIALAWKHRQKRFSPGESLKMALDGFDRVHQFVFSVTDAPIPGRNVTHHRIRSCQLRVNGIARRSLTEEQLVEQMARNLFYPTRAIYCLCLLSGHCRFANVDALELAVELQRTPAEEVIFAVDVREEVCFV